MINLLDAVCILALFILLPYFCYRSKRWPTWKQYLTYEKECIFHKWEYIGDNFRRCTKCGKEQYKVYLDSGILSGWLDMTREK